MSNKKINKGTALDTSDTGNLIETICYIEDGRPEKPNET